MPWIGALRHIDRGYQDLCGDLAALGAEIRREESPAEQTAAGT